MIKIYALKDLDFLFVGFAPNIEGLKLVCPLSSQVNPEDYDKIEKSKIFVYSKSEMKYNWSLDGFIEELGY